MDEISMRYAHCDGLTDICYEDTGKYIISGGNDGDIRVYHGFEDDDPQSHHMGNSVTSVAFSNDVLYVASDEKFTVSAYSFPSIEFEQIVAQFSTAVYHVACSKSGKFVASGGGDFIIKIFDTEDKSLTVLRDHEGPILSLAFDPKEKYLASSACDGTVRIWLLSDQKCIKTLNMFKKSNDLNTSLILCRIDWSPDGQTLAIPSEAEIKFYHRDLWDEKFSLTDSCITQSISVVAYSPFGSYIAAADLNGQMAVWDMQSKRCVSRKPHENKKAVCALKWNPSGKELIFCDIEGQMGLYSSPLTSSPSQESVKDVSRTSHNEFLDIFADEDNKEDDDDDDTFDIGAIKASLEPKIFSEESVLEMESVKSETIKPEVQIVEAPKAPVQAAFQPSSTPINLEHRFMLWNDTGIVRCYNTEEENSIDVEFHDTKVYHPLHMNNTRNHTLAALSTQALLLACPKLDGNTSKLECLHFGTWDSNKEWIVEMPEDEEIEAITLGENFAVCITDKRFVRLFTVSGVQCEVFSIPGPVVCCSAKSNQLLIVYHSGTGIRGDQCLNIMIAKIKLAGHSLIKDCFIPLNSKAFLSWLGFSDEGHPCVVDTSGVVSLLDISCGNKWIPIANTTSNLRNKSDSYFVLGLSEIKQEIRYILCKGSRYPNLLPIPTISILSFTLPFCEMSSDKGKLEEENQKYALIVRCLNGLLKDGFDVDSELNSFEKKRMDVLIKMFALATRSEREYRALNIAELMPNPTVLQGAIRYATRSGHIALAERVGEVMNEKLSQENEATEDEELELLPSEEFSTSLISNSSTMENFNNSLARDNTVLKPKPLSIGRSRSERTVEKFDDSLDVSSHDLSTTSRSLLSNSSPLSNPFKSNTKAQNKKEEVTNPNSIDDLLNNSMKSINTRFSNSSVEEKPKKSRFETKKAANSNTEKGKSGFSLFLEENMDEIKASEPPDVSEKEIIQIAMKRYRELPKSEKQKYLKSSTVVKNNAAAAENSQNNVETKENTSASQNSDTEPFGKRKELSPDDSNEIIKPKKVKLNQAKPADSTLRKLTQYAFTKTSK